MFSLWEDQHHSENQIVIEYDLFVITVLKSHDGWDIEFVVQELEPYTIYSTCMTFGSLDKDLEIYDNPTTIFNFIAKAPRDRLEYNYSAKYLILLDHFGDKVHTSTIQITKKDLSQSDIRNFKLKRMQMENKKLRKEIDKLKKDAELARINQFQLRKSIRYRQNQKKELCSKIKRQECRVQQFKNEREALKQRYQMFLTHPRKEQNYLQRKVKMRKLENGDIFSSTMDKQKISYEQKYEEMANQQEMQKDLCKYQRNLFKKTEESVINLDSNDIIFQQKMHFTVPNQPNSSHYAIHVPGIKKLSASDTSNLIYLLSDQIVKDSTRKSSRIFINFQNRSDEEQVDQKEFYLILGVIQTSNINVLSVTNCKSAIYLHTGKNSIFTYESQFQAESQIQYNYEDTIKMLIDLDNEEIEWYLNNIFLTKVRIPSQMWQEGFHPFLELKAQNSQIQMQ